MGVETFVEFFQDNSQTERFGHPQAVYVYDYATVDPELSSDGYPTADRESGWTDAEYAWFVVASGARTPSGATVIPFSGQDISTSFDERHDGTVLEWSTLVDREFDTDDATVVRDRLDVRHKMADERVETVGELRDRPVSTVVGDDTSTI